MDEGVAFGDLLTYLHDHYGLAHKTVVDKLAELAHILGYEQVTLDTKIRFGDTTILMEEVGQKPATRRELRSYLAALHQLSAEESGWATARGAVEDAAAACPQKRQAHAFRRANRRMKQKDEHVIVSKMDRSEPTPEEAMVIMSSDEAYEDESEALLRRTTEGAAADAEAPKADDHVQRYFEVQNTKELVAMAKRYGDLLEAEHKHGAQVGVAARVTTNSGAVVHFKPLGHWDKHMWDDWLHHLRPCKKIHIRACKDAIDHPPPAVASK